ncbi:hypothetical protein BN946_scf185001.g58 [Trametes cinnabarina]|uniref:Uncharacterized protein n=1 Tax=Pycnoporus cinnabarinus TaxID=5643 RepID=A0A060SKD2_PYCCI|nr:hypothetical protein BN946_scf185001.g58 [Trametes cinnabarina]
MFNSLFKKKGVVIPEAEQLQAGDLPEAEGSTSHSENRDVDSPVPQSPSTSSLPSSIPPAAKPIPTRRTLLSRLGEGQPSPTNKFGERLCIESSDSDCDTDPAVRDARIRESKGLYFPGRSRYVLKHDLKAGDPVIVNVFDSDRRIGTWLHGAVTDEAPMMFEGYLHFQVYVKFCGKKKWLWFYPSSGKILYDTVLALPGARERAMP